MAPLAGCVRDLVSRQTTATETSSALTNAAAPHPSGSSKSASMASKSSYEDRTEVRTARHDQVSRSTRVDIRQAAHHPELDTSHLSHSADRRFWPAAAFVPQMSDTADMAHCNNRHKYCPYRIQPDKTIARGYPLPLATK
ncbi:hypothetical protein AB0C02_29525 [Micromonospora sp. NPDC048999]|uniref:hypothetical protein n=1 Tax=Micromonospora sp. NPDC048999 TaxID=3155391 RepID=UPI003407944E